MTVELWYKGVFLGECGMFIKELRRTNVYKIIISKEPGDRVGYNEKGRVYKIRAFNVGEYIGEGDIIYDELVHTRCISIIADKLVMYATYTQENEKDIFTLISK